MDRKKPGEYDGERKKENDEKENILSMERKNAWSMYDEKQLEQLEKVINDEEFSVHKLSSYLGKKGLLVKDNSRDYTKKNSNGKRYYQIDLKRLEEETNMYLMTEP